MSLVETGLAKLGLTPTEDQLDLIRSYLAEIELWNPRVGLVNAAGEDLVVRHLFDSLAGLPTIAALPRGRLADVGSGAGFPGIPLALFLPESRVALIERSGRRSAFLRNVVALLGLRDRVEVCESDLTEVGERYDLVTFRAVAALPQMVPRLARITEPGGSIVAYKGRREVVERELAVALGPGEGGDTGATFEPFRATLVPVEVPGLREERTIVVLRRQSASGGT